PAPSALTSFPARRSSDLRTGRPRGGDRAGDHGLPFPARHLEVEQVRMTWRPPRVMKCPSRLAGRGRRLDTGALRVRNKSGAGPADRKSTRLNSSHSQISY